MVKSQIIKDIAQDSITIESALQRLLVISYTLDNPELQQWIENELNGYTSDSIIPDYRKNVAYMIMYTGFNANTLVKKQPLSESYFGSELQEVLKTRTIKDGLNIIEDTIKNKNEVAFNLIDCAGIISNNSDGMIKCVSLEQVISKTTFLRILSSVKTKLIQVLLDLEKEFGSLDNLDIDISDKSADELSKVNAEITRKLYFDGRSGEIF
ncbi:hypothetical protein [Ligilactobacillus animalis]|jgi:hypothetical protein|uniref:AbiTii domain-containing protein n=1 Tax=Ligilactobacillus animalis TaxID=1605 RepID=UPI002598327B|nr:hypothetical protein [Ligilactobacillus animalis]